MNDSDYAKRRERIAAQILAAWINRSQLSITEDDVQRYGIRTILEITDKLIEKLDEVEKE